MCHVVLQSGLRGIIPLRNLLAPSWPASSAICCYEALSHRQPGSSWASTGLLKLCCHEDKREQRCSSLTRDLFSTRKQVLISHGVCMQTMFYSIYALRSFYSYMLTSISQINRDGTFIQLLARHIPHHIMLYWLIWLLLRLISGILNIIYWMTKWRPQRARGFNRCRHTFLSTRGILKQWEEKRS